MPPLHRIQYRPEIPVPFCTNDQFAMPGPIGRTRFNTVCGKQLSGFGGRQLPAMSAKTGGNDSAGGISVKVKRSGQFCGDLMQHFNITGVLTEIHKSANRPFR